MKRAILILSILAILLIFGGIVVTIGAAGTGCTTTATGQASCTNGATAGVGIGVLLYILGVLATAVAWILGMIKTITIRRWGWFVLVLLLSPLGSLIYSAAGPDQPAA